MWVTESLSERLQIETPPASAFVDIAAARFTYRYMTITTADPQPDAPAENGPRVVTISDSAIVRIKHLREVEGDEGLMLRVSVSGGGCSGFQYGFTLDATINDDDLVFERDGVKVLVDEVSLDLLGGSEVDYVQQMVGAYFTLQNPNAASTCGCGSSFSL